MKALVHDSVCAEGRERGFVHSFQSLTIISPDVAFLLPLGHTLNCGGIWGLKAQVITSVAKLTNG